MVLFVPVLMAALNRVAIFIRGLFTSVKGLPVAVTNSRGQSLRCSSAMAPLGLSGSGVPFKCVCLHDDGKRDVFLR